MARSSELEIWQHLGGLLWELLLCNAFCGSNPALSARTPKKPPIQAVFFRQHPRTYAGSCGFFLTSSLQLREHYLARSLSWGPIFSALLPYLVAAKLVSVGTWLFIIQ